MMRLASTPSSSPGVGNGAVKPADHGRKRHAAHGVALRIEEHLHMADVVGPCALKVRPGEVVKILLGHEHRHAQVIDVEKILQVAELIGPADGFDRVVGQLHVVALGQRKHQFRLEAAFDVNVQLAFGQAFDQRFNLGHRVVCPPPKARPLPGGVEA